MALSATIVKIELSVSDIDHGCYEDHTLTLARHPSETEDRMMVRLIAFALRAHRLAEVDASLTFSAGLPTPDTSDLLLADLTGRELEAIMVGQPDEKTVTKAVRRAESVVVHPFGTAVEQWWRTIAPRVGGFETLTVVQLPSAQIKELGAQVSRRMAVQVTVLEGEITVTVGENDPVQLVPVLLQG
ncbi:hypothetical protein C8046_11255 [Serinibacter arcticus]|uniref:YaeQ protein n=1 Tax=Serinibacter arcticus TaxID=1655435 RepID=A0A2U1ZVW7_9MICO|nr:YaeQ family protein [Serinibacter arcticus]PWD51135.1 hypothetical protein C8046_11255 [Serinibacter arcticus]